MIKCNFSTLKLVLSAFFMLATSVLTGQTESEQIAIRQSYDQQRLNNLKQIFLQQSAEQQQRVQQLAAVNNWPLHITNSDGTVDDLVAVTEDGIPVYYTVYNVAAALSTRTNHLHTGGSLGLNLDGQNMTFHVWDGGPTRPTHQEFDGPGGNNRIVISDGATTLNGNSFHAQHVTGTIGASGFVANAKGMAPQARVNTYDWNNDLSEATTAASNGMLLSNHSYGFRLRDNQGNPTWPNWHFGAYRADARDWDNLMHSAPYYLMVKSAGNDGNDNSVNGAPIGGNSLFDKLIGNSTAKNILLVANAQDVSVLSNGIINGTVNINSSSSEGPTDDLKIKPDITGNGTGVYSTFDGSDSDYASITGTSMSSPNVAGSLLLLQQHYNNVNGNFMKAATLKGLALHTADDAGISGPDAVFGWGLLNAKAMAETISDNGNETKVEELVLNNGGSYSIVVDSDGSSPLLASISWTDPAGTVVNTGINNLATPVLVNDLDIRVTQNSSTYTPYKLTGVNSNTQADNNVDPYERVDISGASGSYTITVTHKGSLQGGSQAFSLVVTGLSSVPCNPTTPTSLTSSNIAATTATLSWDAIPSASYEVRYRETGTSTWTTESASSNSLNLTGLTASTQYEAQVRTVCSGSNSSYSSSTNFTTTTISCSTTVSSFPYTEGFEANDGWTQLTGDDGNWVRNSGVTPSNTTGPSSATEGSFYMFLEASTNNSPGQIGPNATAILESPCFVLPASTTIEFSFGYHMYGANMGSLTVQASTDGTTFTDLWSLSGDQGNSWQSQTLDLSAYAGSTVKLRMVGTTGSSWRSDVAIDDLELTTTTPDTQAPSVPTSLSASNVNDNSATLSWAASSDNVGVTGYDVYVDNVLDGSATGTSYAITGLSPGTQYSLTVRAKDAAGNVSAASSALSITTTNNVTYCASNGANANFEWIDYVALGDMTNTSGSDGGYADNTSIVANVGYGSNRVYVSAGFSGQSYTEFWRVWIDYDQDGTFESNELVASGSSSSANNLYVDFTIPTSALAGNTRMRVSMKYNSAQTACEQNFAYGEVEDYTVNISNAPNYSIDQNSLAQKGGDIMPDEIPAGLKVFPNPTVVEFQLEVQARGEKRLDVVNMSGETVMTINNYKGDKVNVEHLESGLYIIRYFDGQKTITKKLKKE